METITYQLKEKIFKRDNFKCLYCKRKFPNNELHLDHIHPKSLGGSNKPSNLATACFTCNLKKSNKVLKNPPKVKNIRLTEGDLVEVEPSPYSKVIRLTPENYKWLEKNKWKWSTAGLLNKILLHLQKKSEVGYLEQIIQEFKKPNLFNRKKK